MADNRDESNAEKTLRSQKLAADIQQYYARAGFSVAVAVNPDGSLSSNIAQQMGRPDAVV